MKHPNEPSKHTWRFQQKRKEEAYIQALHGPPCLAWVCQWQTTSNDAWNVHLKYLVWAERDPQTNVGLSRRKHFQPNRPGYFSALINVITLRDHLVPEELWLWLNCSIAVRKLKFAGWQVYQNRFVTQSSLFLPWTHINECLKSKICRNIDRLVILCGPARWTTEEDKDVALDQRRNLQWLHLKWGGINMKLYPSWEKLREICFRSYCHEIRANQLTGHD